MACSAVTRGAKFSGPNGVIAFGLKRHPRDAGHILRFSVPRSATKIQCVSC